MCRTCCQHVVETMHFDTSELIISHEKHLSAVFTFQQVQIGHTAVSASDIQTYNNFDFI